MVQINGIFVIKSESPTGHLLFARYVVFGDLVEVTQYMDSDLISERDMTREEARKDYKERLIGGWTKSDPATIEKEHVEC